MHVHEMHTHEMHACWLRQAKKALIAELTIG
jgi:hypothetical protein